ncbi:MAG: hypothetical protein UT28_C0001G0310 [Berkelbacteria bacterium GW2011_GWE1_39_12]|uniref:Uncharacterized protein n=1 Tax=Berkelbacteria bacterium GW2011_GWE1_39_12 TaxID=1618337 RepID=A0A0G4B2L5_9BACT|nr:MAG: hypothetical protein UT28_C0001G0310 [Berkelbacteria bacterium GW2011_GWE1_39_12]
MILAAISTSLITVVVLTCVVFGKAAAELVAEYEAFSES